MQATADLTLAPSAGQAHDRVFPAEWATDSNLYQTARSCYRFLRHERRTPTSVPLTRKLGMWRRGFFAESAAIYDLPHNDVTHYLSDYQHLVRCSRVNSWNALYRHKLVLRSMLTAMGLPQPCTEAVVLDGRILVGPFGGNPRYVSPDELLEHLARDGGMHEYLVKPEDGPRTRAIFLLSCRDGRFFRHRGRAVERIDAEDLLAELRASEKGRPASAILIERRVEQGPFWTGLFPGSINSIRLLTLWTPGESAPFLARAVQRIGTAETVPTANWSRGGLSALVDRATGQLGVARRHPLKGRRGRPVVFDRHPDTGAAITGSVLPQWEVLRTAVLRVAACLPYNRMTAWDAVVDSAGRAVILEAEGNGDVNLLQAHGGLLADPQVRRFYAALHVV